MRPFHTIVLIIVVAAISIFGTIAVMPKHHTGKANIAKAEDLLQTIAHHKIKILKHFPAVGNLQGFVVTAAKGGTGKKGIIYADNQGRYVIAGAVLNAKGQNLATLDFDKYIQPKAASKAYKTIGTTSWIGQGNANAPHKMYAVVDPNCIFCHRSFEALQPKIASGQLAVRWIVIGIIKPSSKGKALAIFNAKDPLAALKTNEKKFNEANEEGGIKPVDVGSMTANSSLSRNMRFATENAITETPTVYYKTAAGVMKIQHGLPSGKALDAIIAKMGNQF